MQLINIMENYQINVILNKLKKSRFRSSFKLSEKDINIIKEKGFETMKQHALEILSKRIKIKPLNDGKQTPLRAYPVFIAQHATATCCRKCISKWYNIPEDKILTNKELDFFSDLIIEWMKKRYQMKEPIILEQDKGDQQ